MADWKEMYLKMFRASEKAMRALEAAQPDCGKAVQTLEAAQLECEEMYLRDGDDEYEPERDIEDIAAELDKDDDGYLLERDLDDEPPEGAAYALDGVKYEPDADDKYTPEGGAADGGVTAREAP